MQALQTEEFSIRAQVLPSSEILKHATTNAGEFLARSYDAFMEPDLFSLAAKMLNKSSLLGTVAAGAFADLLVLKTNPLEDITILDRPEDNMLAILKEGRVVMSKVAGLQKSES